MSENNLWVVRLGKQGQYEYDALERNLISIDFGVSKEPKELRDLALIRNHMAEVYPQANSQQIGIKTGQINTFINLMEKGDIVICPLKIQSGKLYIGRILKKCTNENQFLSHKVEWLTENPLSRNKFQGDFLNTFGSHLTVFKVKSHNALQRVMEVIKNVGDENHKDGGPRPTIKTSDIRGNSSEAEEYGEDFNLEEAAFEQIAMQISSLFVGHDFANLIEEILKAQGYETKSPGKGPDDGVDIIAGKGDLGFGEPRIIVQVKSCEVNAIQVDHVFSTLKGKYDKYGANHGLFVSWEGFPTKVKKQETEDFFNVRLWGRDEILEEFFKVYDKLPEEITTKLPLQKVWMVVPKTSVGD